MPGGKRRDAVVIEDDADLRDLVEATLTDAGFACHTTGSGLDGIAAVRAHQPILTTLDVGLPGIDGFEVARRIRDFSNTYIIILSARAEEIDTLMGLDAGADDYLIKPFRPRELRARIEAMLRRYQVRWDDPPVAEGDGQGANGASDAGQNRLLDEDAAGALPEALWLSHNGLRVNPDMRLCELNGRPLDLTRSEFEVLVAIMLGERRVISKDSLALDVRGPNELGGYVSESDRRVIESHLAHLRRKLDDPVSAPRFIETVRGVGYRLTAPQHQG
ncbi:MAG: response regulator transcription factor [Propionibacteriaceae bacterium]|nr:response regulator transcription factor [Propionibacteriaceae bacterium]